MLTKNDTFKLYKIQWDLVVPTFALFYP